MRRLTFACFAVPAVVLLIAAPAMAQKMPKGDVAASYSVMYDRELADSSGISGWLATGWVASGAVRVTGNLSLVGEVGANYKSISDGGIDATVNVYCFLGGVRYGGRVSPKVSPFVQMLFGLSRINVSGTGASASGNQFATEIGGGIDVFVSRKLAVRLQGDYRALRADGSYDREFRVATGIVYRF